MAGRPSPAAARLRVGRKGRAKLANRNRLNALAAVEKKQDAEAAALQRRAHRQHFAAARADRERLARASPAESTQCHHTVHPPSTGSVGQEPRFERNNASAAPGLLAAHPQAEQDCRQFLLNLRRHLRHKPAGVGTYGLVVETLTLCARGCITSLQMLTSLRNILGKYPHVLRALTSLLTRVHTCTNTNATPPAVAALAAHVQPDASEQEHAAALLTLDSSRSDAYGAAAPQAAEPADSHDGSASSGVAAQAPCTWQQAHPAHVATMCLLEATQRGLQWQGAQHGVETRASAPGAVSS